MPANRRQIMLITDPFHPANMRSYSEVCARAGLSQAGLTKLIDRGVAPPPYKYNAACALFRNDEIEAWISSYRKGERRTKKRSRMARAPEM
jgi:predicted DNA-binding transcriptional regulator AlpA